MFKVITQTTAFCWPLQNCTNFTLPLLTAIELVTCGNLFLIYLLSYTVLWRSSFRFPTMQFYLLRFSSGMYYLHLQGDWTGSGGCISNRGAEMYHSHETVQRCLANHSYGRWEQKCHKEGKISKNGPLFRPRQWEMCKWCWWCGSVPTVELR